MWFKWAVISILVLECLGRIEQIGAVHEYTKNDALAQLIFNLLIVIDILYYWR